VKPQETPRKARGVARNIAYRRWRMPHRNVVSTMTLLLFYRNGKS
jgi:hypothetical protein